MKEKKAKRIIEVPVEKLESVSGGTYFGTSKADKVCDAIGEIYTDYVRVNPPKWPCPKCGSWNVGNYDPGTIWQMRVYCKDCGFFGCRDGDDDDEWGDDIADELEEMGILKFSKR